MNKKVLIAGGCSYTDKDFRTRASDFDMPEKTWPMWPEHLAEKLDLGYVNVARSGYDNFTIFQTVLNAITLNKNKVDTVVVLWSGWDRSLLFNSFNTVTLHAFYNTLTSKETWAFPEWVLKTNFNNFVKDFLNTDWWDPPSFTRDSVSNTISLMNALALICESKNIKYIFYQGVEPLACGYINMIEDLIERPSGKKRNIENIDVLKQIKKTSGSGELESRKRNIIGWPFIPDAGGHFLDSIRFDKKFFPDGPMNLSKMDLHPGAEAQPIISDLFYNQWKKVYG